MNNIERRTLSTGHIEETLNIKRNTKVLQEIESFRREFKSYHGDNLNITERMRLGDNGRVVMSLEVKGEAREDRPVSFADHV